MNELVKQGFVDQQSRGKYSLSVKGKKLVDNLSSNRTNPHKMPKVITYTKLVDGDAVLLLKKDKEPYMGLLNMVGGKLHEGELASEAAVREVFEKTSLKVNEPELSGIFEIRIENAGSLISHAIAYVFTVKVDPSDYENTSLVRFATGFLNNEKQFAPDLVPILNNIDSQTKPVVANITLDWAPLN